MLNLCQFIGNVGKDPEIRAMQDGKEVANLSLGVSESWKDKSTGERKQKTEWVKVSCFNEGLVGVIKNYVHKGSKLYISGKMQTKKWVDKDGQDRYSTEIQLQSLEMLDSKKSDNSEQSEHDKQKADGYQPDNGGDEVPF